MNGCTYQLGVGADRRHSRPKESIETMKGMAIQEVPRYDDRSVCSTMWGGGRSGDDNDFTGGAGGTSQASRRGGAGAPSKSSTKGKHPHKSSNSQMRFCGKTGVVGKM